MWSSSQSFSPANIIGEKLTVLKCRWFWFNTLIYIYIKRDNFKDNCPVGWVWRIYRLHLCRGVKPYNESRGYDTKKSDGEAPVMQELWGIQSIPSLPSLTGPLWPGAVAPDRVLSMGRIELNCVLMLNRISWDRTFLTFKQRTYAKLNWLKKNYSDI